LYSVDGGRKKRIQDSNNIVGTKRETKIIKGVRKEGRVPRVPPSTILVNCEER
jgi:hypothetical protein